MGLDRVHPATRRHAGKSVMTISVMTTVITHLDHLVSSSHPTARLLTDTPRAAGRATRGRAAMGLWAASSRRGVGPRRLMPPLTLDISDDHISDDYISDDQINGPTNIGPDSQACHQEAAGRGGAEAGERAAERRDEGMDPECRILEKRRGR